MQDKSKRFFLEHKLISIHDFDKIQISFDTENVYISGVKLKRGDLNLAEKGWKENCLQKD